MTLTDKEKKEITLKHIGYHCQGIAMLNFWGGGQAPYHMDKWRTQTKDRKTIAEGVNDGRFGCESIESADVLVYDLYEDNYTVFSHKETFTKDELTEAKRGI